MRKTARATNVSICIPETIETIIERTWYVKRTNTLAIRLVLAKRESSVRRSSVAPAETLALLFRNLLCQSERLRAAIVANRSQDGIDQSSGRGVRGAKGGGFDGGQKDLVAFPR